jgi:hypothetical protein
MILETIDFRREQWDYLLMESGILIGMTPKPQVGVLNAKLPVFVIG